MIFFSYSNADYSEVSELRNHLESSGYKCWVASSDILPGENYQNAVPTAIDSASAVILILSESSQQSKWVYKEIGMAVSSGKTIIAWKVDDKPLSLQFKFVLEGAQIEDALNSKQASFEKLIQSLRRMNEPINVSKSGTRTINTFTENKSPVFSDSSDKQPSVITKLTLRSKTIIRLIACCIVLILIVILIVSRVFTPIQTIISNPKQLEVAFENTIDHDNSNITLYQENNLIECISISSINHRTFAKSSLLMAAVLDDGTVRIETYTSNTIDPGWSDIVEVAANNYFVFGLTSYGTVMCWDAMFDREVYGGNVSTWFNIVQIAACEEHVVGLKEDGTVVVEGTEALGDMGMDLFGISTMHNIRRITTGWQFVIGIDKNGQIVEEGSTYDEWNDVIELEADLDFFIGVRSDGTLAFRTDYDYLPNEYGLDSWTNIVDIAIGYKYIVGLKNDGTLISAGETPIDFSSWDNVIDIRGDNNGDIVGLTSDGTLLCTDTCFDNYTDWTNVRLTK